MISAAQLWAPVEIALNHYLSLDPSSRERLAPLAGKTIGLEVRGIPGQVLLRVGDGVVNVLSRSEQAADSTIRASLFTWFRLGLSRDASASAAMGEVDLGGDVHTARRFQKFWYGVDIDWEEQLSRVLGDVAAHQVGRLARSAGTWLKQVNATLQQDTAEYLQEEARQLAIPAQVELFLSDVDRLRHDVDRLAVRVKRLNAKLNPADSE